jgi:hypothetical protein
MNKLNKSIIAALCLTLIVVVGYRLYLFVGVSAAKPKPMPTVTIDPELLRRAEKELSPQTIFKAVELKNKLRDRDSFMRECRTLSREQLLQRIEDLAWLAGNCQE